MKITISNLRKTFASKVAVDIPSLVIDDGEVVGLVGNNGAGKTTLFRLILDLLSPDNGEVALKPYSPDPLKERIMSIYPAKSEMWKPLTGAYIDSSFLIDFLTAEEYFEFVGKVSGISKNKVQERLKEYGDFMNGEVLDQKKYLRDFSAGNKQKVGIIAALLHEPQLVILDEPFNFLDPSSQSKLKKLLTSYSKKTGTTILISSHNLRNTVEISSRIILLEHGIVRKDLDNSDGLAEKELEEYFDI